MEPRLQPVFTREPMAQPGVVVAESQNRVLRNTYWLLALSMLPTIAGAWVGHADEFRRRCSARRRSWRRC